MKGNGRKLLMWLSVADAFTSLNYLATVALNDPGNDDTLCKVQALIGIYFPVSSFMWTDCIAWYLYQVVNHSYELNHATELEHQKYLFPLFHGLSWGVPAFLCILIGSFGAEGYNDKKTGGWCWIKSDTESPGTVIAWELVGGKAIEWFSCLVFVPYLYISAYFRLRRLYQSDPQREKFHAFTRRLILVPVVFFAIRLWGSILALEAFTDSDTAVNAFGALSAFFDPSQGFFNGLIFVFTSGEVREAIKHFVTGLFQKNNSHGDSTIEPTAAAVDPSTASFLLHRPSEFEDDGTPFYSPVQVPVTHYEEGLGDEHEILASDMRFQKLINET